MKIKCSKCNVIYNVDESKIPAKGAVTRCKKCQNEILIKPPVKNSLNAGMLLSKEMSMADKIEKTKEKASSLNKIAKEKVGKYSEKIKTHAHKLDKEAQLSANAKRVKQEVISDLKKFLTSNN